jgi:hypothetical protein
VELEQFKLLLGMLKISKINSFKEQFSGEK